MLPEAGDVAWVEFDPVLGAEQAGRRPALVVSEREYHEISSRALVCPITSRARPWPF
jgi:mRNA interferase MazF